MVVGFSLARRAGLKSRAPTPVTPLRDSREPHRGERGPVARESECHPLEERAATRERETENEEGEEQCSGKERKNIPCRRKLSQRQQLVVLGDARLRVENFERASQVLVPCQRKGKEHAP